MRALQRDLGVIIVRPAMMCHALSCRGALRSRAEKCQCYQMVGRYRKAQFDHASAANYGFAFGQIDFDIVMFEERLVQRMDRLVHGLLGHEQQPPR